LGKWGKGNNSAQYFLTPLKESSRHRGLILFTFSHTKIYTFFHQSCRFEELDCPVVQNTAEVSELYYYSIKPFFSGVGSMNRREKDSVMKNRTKALVFLITLIVATGFFLPVHAARAVTCNGFPDVFGRVAVSVEGNYIATGDPVSGSVRVLEKDGTPHWGYTIGENISGLWISDDGGIIAAATDEGRVLAWDKKGNLLWNFGGMGRFTQVMMTADGERGYLVNSDSHSNP
jgi:hypothetical protein